MTATAAETRSLLRVPLAARPANRTVLAALIAALVLGILGMHALASHGMSPAPTGAAAAATTQMVDMSSHDAHAHPATAAAATGGTHSTPAAAENSTPAGSGHHTTAMVMLCVVMLAAAALTLLALLAVRLLRPLLPAAFKPASTPGRTMRWVLGAGPPPAWQFSVIRC